MPAIFSLPLGRVAPRKPSTALGTIIKPAVERVAPRRNWRRVNWDGGIFVLCFIKFGGSCQNILYHMAVHVREAETAALVQIRESFVIDAEEMQDSRLQIVNVNRSRSESAFVGIDGIAVGISNVISVII